jgi:hypothetical protein
MTRNPDRDRQGRGLLSLAVMAVFLFAAWWAVTTLFPTELRQTGRWVSAKLESLRR